MELICHQRKIIQRFVVSQVNSIYHSYVSSCSRKGVGKVLYIHIAHGPMTHIHTAMIHMSMIHPKIKADQNAENILVHKMLK